MSDRNIRNILLVRTDRIGDVILTLPMAQAIRENFADAKVGFLARQYTAPILEISTYIDEILLRETPELAQKLREYDAAILVHPTPKDALALWKARIPMRIGTAYRAYSFLFTHRVAEHRMDCKFHELTYNLHLLRPLGIEIDWLPPRLVPPRDALAEARKMLHDKGIAENKAIVLHPGSKGSSLKWGAEHFRRLGELIVRHGIPLLVTAGDDEESLAEYVAGERGIVICGLNLKTLAALYTLAVAVVAPNTGTLHLADAVGTRAFCVYPALRTMSPARWAPANFPGGAIVPQHEICAKCSRSCGIYPCPDAVTPQQVFQKMAIFLEQIGG